MFSETNDSVVSDIAIITFTQEVAIIKNIGIDEDICNLLNVSENLNESTLKLYPNPTLGKIKIDYCM